MRASGVLLPISSLTSKYGIGCFSKEAYEFVDKLKLAGQKYWQILPLGPIGYGDSPYQSFSTFAGNPYYIDLEKMIQCGWLTQEECDSADFGQIENSIDYGLLYQNRYPLLKKAFLKSEIWKDDSFKEFVEKQKDWIEDYALFMAIKDQNGGACWDQWEDDLRFRKEEALAAKAEELKEEILYYEFMQYIFWTQWKELKGYANEQGIKIVGDIPIYVSFDSADAWAGTELFQFDKERRPSAVAGCPPDGFSATGQLWGNPLYRWDYHAETGFAWWIKRLAYCFDSYDVVRIDHFRGFDEYFSIPYGDPDARGGHWEKGPGIALFDRMKKVLGEKEIIAEDLGYVTDTVRKLVKDSGFPGMKVLEFAFDSRDSGSAADYRPHNYPENCVVYTGTHDNETVVGWFNEGLQPEERQMVRDYICNPYVPDQEIYKPMICLAMASVAKYCIIPLTDYLGLGNEARINTPSTSGDNWKWRLLPGQLTDQLIQDMKKLVERYNR